MTHVLQVIIGLLRHTFSGVFKVLMKRITEPWTFPEHLRRSCELLGLKLPTVRPYPSRALPIDHYTNRLHPRSAHRPLYLPVTPATYPSPLISTCYSRASPPPITAPLIPTHYSPDS